MNTIANNGDFYLNTLTGEVFVKSDNLWLPIANIKGAQGAQGIQGIQGLKGDKGDPGIQGLKGDTGLAGKNGATWICSIGVPLISVGSIGDFYLDSSSCDVYSKSSLGWQKILNIKGSPGSSERLVNAQWNFINQRLPTVTDSFVFASIFDYDLTALPGFNLNSYNGTMNVMIKRNGPVSFKVSWDASLIVDLLVDGKRVSDLGKVRSWGDQFGQNLMVTACLPIGTHTLNLKVTSRSLTSSARVSFNCDLDMLSWSATS